MLRMNFLTAVAVTLAATSAQADVQLSVATGGTGGVYYPLGGGVAEVINNNIDGYSATAEVTGASVENVSLVASGDADLAFVLGNVAIQAYGGAGRFEEQAVSQLRAVSTIYSNMIQIVALADSGITSLDDLRGKRVSIGAPGSGNEVNSSQVLGANGITYDDFDEQRLNFNETADALGNGDIDVGIWSVGAPTSSILNLSTVHDITVVPLTDTQIDAVIAKYPTYSRTTMAGGTYKGLDADMAVLGIPNVLVASAEMDEDEVYQITKAIYENLGDLQAVHPAAKETSVELAMGSTPIPLHPGAIRYFEEIGATIPYKLRP
ncbi:MAG: C4-dicarboxylate ABC transporter substrate-binding protein [Roseovarius sp. BRH_c41]|uniref:TAXI family TRAP transporter solute-binding subunit n=1 Tax=Roseovarius sp. BRH_c41 TaxID=1629709 RepID=UPI0005F1FB81|nr:TAXI family TRAP transporter solute-binding subunit [Roseovarius sp. BRH_c41]KJS43140.1 MAG: C4-dicarboxylate ABC transporter substrate-binding protein [Roseovarius sp. BRH_c41]